eukprot:1533457-Karenia_brevis.AAC.1
MSAIDEKLDQLQHHIAISTAPGPSLLENQAIGLENLLDRSSIQRIQALKAGVSASGPISDDHAPASAHSLIVASVSSGAAD